MNSGAAANSHDISRSRRDEPGAPVEDEPEQLFEALISRVTPRLRHLAYHFTRNWADADDITQIAMLKAFRYRARVMRVAHPEAYLKQILVRACIDHLRKRSMQEYVTAELPDVGVEPADEQVWVVRQALGQVPPAQREVLLMRYYLDLSVVDAARALGCSTGNVKSQTSRGLAALKRNMQCARAQP